MTYLKRQSTTPQSAPIRGTRYETAQAASPGRSTTGRGCAASSSSARRAAATTPASGTLTRENARGGRALPRGRRPRAPSPTIVDDQRGRPGAEERPGGVRARDGGRPRRRGDAARRRSRRCRACAASRRTCSSSPTFVEGFRGWGRALRRAVGGWYAARSPESLAYQAVKYRQRDGMTHRDLLRLAHPAGRVGAGNPTLELERRAPPPVRVDRRVVASTDGLPRIVEGFALAQSAETPARAAELVREYGLPREAVPTRAPDLARRSGRRCSRTCR